MTVSSHYVVWVHLFLTNFLFAWSDVPAESGNGLAAEFGSGFSAELGSGFSAELGSGFSAKLESDLPDDLGNDTDYLNYNAEEFEEDTSGIVNKIEKISISQIPHVPAIEPVKLANIENSTITPMWMIKRYTLFQNVAVRLRTAYETLLRSHATWMCQWYEVHIPEKYNCVAWKTIKIVNEQYRAYPKLTISQIKAVKESLIKSYARKIPLSTVSPQIFKNLDETFNGFVSKLISHERYVQKLAEEKIKDQVRKVQKRCELPFGDRHPNVFDYYDENGTETTTLQEFEDYATQEYGIMR